MLLKAVATETMATINHYGASTNLMRVNGVPVFFWYFHPSVSDQDIGLAVTPKTPIKDRNGLGFDEKFHW